MSLINNMLRDLEERHALAGGRDGKVLGDLHAADERVFPVRSGRVPHPVFLLLTGLLICYLGYDFYAATYAPEPTAMRATMVAGERQPKLYPITPVEPTPHRLVPAGERRPESEGIMLKLASLRMDTTAFSETVSASGTDVPSVVPEAVPAKTEDRNAAPAARTNRLLHIGLTELAGGSSVLVNTSAYPDFSLFLLQDPDRLLVEIKELDMPAGIVDAPYRSDIVTRLRHGSRGDIGLLIFDLTRPVEINSTDVRNMPDGGYSLDIELLSAVQLSSSPPAADQGGTTQPASAAEVPQTFQKNATGKGGNRTYQDAMTAYRAGDVLHAIDLLYQLLAKDPLQLQARETLATVLIQQHDRRSAGKVLSDGLALHPDNAHLIKLYAKLLYNGGQVDQALAYLHRARPDISTDPDYYALMAAVLQHRKDYLEAGELYRKLVAVRPASGVWWMGLGISLEGSGQSGEALQAYANARKDTTLAPDLVRYIDIRIRSLGG